MPVMHRCSLEDKYKKECDKDDCPYIGCPLHNQYVGLPEKEVEKDNE